MIVGSQEAIDFGRGFEGLRGGRFGGGVADNGFSKTGLFGVGVMDGELLDAFNLASKNALFSLKEELPLRTALQIFRGSGLRTPMVGDGCSNVSDDDFVATSFG